MNAPCPYRLCLDITTGKPRGICVGCIIYWILKFFGAYKKELEK